MVAGRGRPEKDHGGVSPVSIGLFRHPDRVHGPAARPTALRAHGDRRVPGRGGEVVVPGTIQAGVAREVLGYRLNSAAGALASGRTRSIGVVTLGTDLHGPASLLIGVERAARDAG
jgi:hypothetical protein